MANFSEQREKLEKIALSNPHIDSALTFLEKKTQIKKVYILYGKSKFLNQRFHGNFLSKPVKR